MSSGTWGTWIMLKHQKYGSFSFIGTGKLLCTQWGLCSPACSAKEGSSPHSIHQSRLISSPLGQWGTSDAHLDMSKAMLSSSTVTPGSTVPVNGQGSLDYSFYMLCSISLASAEGLKKKCRLAVTKLWVIVTGIRRKNNLKTWGRELDQGQDLHKAAYRGKS